MNIAVFTKSLQRGGAEKQSVLLTSVISDRHKTMLVVWNGDGPDFYSSFIKDSNIDVRLLKGNFIKKLADLTKLLKKEKTEALFCYLLSTNFIGLLAGKLSGVKHIIGGIRNSFHPKWKEILLRIMHNYFTDITITNSYSSVGILKKKNFNEKKLTVIPNGIVINRNTKPGNAPGEVRILTVARFVEQKDHYSALDAVKKLEERLREEKNPVRVKYTLVGYGELENKIREKIKNEGLDDIVELQNDKAMKKLYLNSDIYLCSSLYEGVSNSILEAMDFSLPVVATDAGDNNMLVSGGRNGFITAIKDIGALADSLYKLTVDPELRNRMGRESKKILEENYSVQIFTERYIRFIESLKDAKQPELGQVVAGKN